MKCLRKATRWLRSRFVHGALILGYHRIAVDGHDPYGNCVSPQHFADQLAVLRRSARLIHLHELVDVLQHGQVPRRTVAITFDDGYVDNLYTAKPLLERYEAPATVFITTGYLGRQFWWDELANIILSTRVLPKRLSLSIAGKIYEWQADDATRKRPKSGTGDLRHGLLWSLYRRLEPINRDEQLQTLESLRAWVSADTSGPAIPSILRPDEVVRLTEGCLIDLGAHSVTHPPLASLPNAAQQSEIQQSKMSLEQLLGRPVQGFAYPHGSATPTTRTLVRETGFAWACASFNDVARRGSDPFHLPRFWVPDWNGTKFSRWLERWLHG